LIFKPGAMELWDVAPPAPEGGPGPARLAKRAISPFTPQRFFPTCVGGAPGSTYNDKQCWEWSPDRRVLAVAYTPEEPINALTQHLLIGIDDLEIERLEVPGPASRSFTSFAFSPDNQWLALGNSGGMWLYDRAAKEWARWIPGDHKRNRALAPMRFTSDSSRVIALGDQLQISVYDVGTGSMAGRHDPTFENWEGELKLSADGSRIVVYKFLSDTFEVLDGSDAKRLGWVCPYFCNVRHNPVQPGYAVSPDGRSVAISHRRGAAVWNTATDTMRFALRDPKRKPLPYPMQR